MMLHLIQNQSNYIFLNKFKYNIMNKIVFTLTILAILFIMSCNNSNSKSTDQNDVIKRENISNAQNVNTDNVKLEVYAFHGTRQCETCKNMKANTKATLDKYFAEELKSGKIVYQIIDVDDIKNEKLAEKFQATGTALMINKVVNGKDNISDWSDFAFDKANDPNAFIPELKTKITSALK